MQLLIRELIGRLIAEAPTPQAIIAIAGEQVSRGLMSKRGPSSGWWSSFRRIASECSIAEKRRLSHGGRYQPPNDLAFAYQVVRADGRSRTL